MDNDKMTETSTQYVPRPRDPPQPQEVLEQMVTNRCYVVADLVVKFENQYGPSRGTVRNRLEFLVEEGNVERQKHTNGTVTYRRAEDSQ
jgi:Fe2+ or Zn2+ uptake regulation protein